MPLVEFDSNAHVVTGTKPLKLRLGDWYCVPQFSKKQNPNFPLEATDQGVAINKDEKIGTYAKRQEGFRPKLNKLLSRWLTKSKGKTMTIAIEPTFPAFFKPVSPTDSSSA